MAFRWNFSSLLTVSVAATCFFSAAMFQAGATRHNELNYGNKNAANEKLSRFQTSDWLPGVATFYGGSDAGGTNSKFTH